MSTFVLVHGAWHGGWCWKKTASVLREAGHDVYAPTLTGLGARAHLAHQDVGLSTHVTDVAQTIRYEDLSDVTLVGHSYAGLVITGVAEKVKDNLAALVYLDAYIGEDGAAMLDMISEDRRAVFQGNKKETGEDWLVPPVSPERFGVTDPTDRDWVARRLTPHPARCFSEALTTTGAYEAVGRKGYVRCCQYDNPVFDTILKQKNEDDGWTALALDEGHDVMITAPDVLACALELVAEE